MCRILVQRIFQRLKAATTIFLLLLVFIIRLVQSGVVLEFRIWRSRSIHVPNVLAVDPWVRRLRLLDGCVMCDRIRAEVFSAVLVLQMKILNLVILEKIVALQAFRDLIHLLRLGARDVIRCQLQVAREPAAFLAKVSDQVRLAHQVILPLHHDCWRAGSLPESRLDCVWNLLVHLTVHWCLLLRLLSTFWLRFRVSLLLLPYPVRVKLFLHNLIVGPEGLRSGR